VALKYQSKQFTVFVNTDKALYRTGEIVRFRAFAINASTIASSTFINPNVTIYDPNNVKIREFLNVTFVKGKYENSIQLADRVNLGNWLVRVDAEGEVFKKAFEVEDYIAPLLYVNLVTPLRVSFTAGK